eukprot:GHVU01110273.1.p1 GENE.GHVU01110273.1~~GHVU01110273.1.p1  ORF type:complete len:171 (+),score=31.15 GHVU01110273.1:709-1221(+)
MLLPCQLVRGSIRHSPTLHEASSPLPPPFSRLPLCDRVAACRTGYEARRESELPVLGRWVSSRDIAALSKAKFLDLILYSREQIAKENSAMRGQTTVEVDPAAPLWSVISVKAQDEDHELPMSPITMMRNALIEEGGSGVGIDRAQYRRAVEYWRAHVEVRHEEAGAEED